MGVSVRVGAGAPIKVETASGYFHLALFSIGRVTKVCELKVESSLPSTGNGSILHNIAREGQTNLQLPNLSPAPTHATNRRRHCP